ncbi:MAG: PAS domain-containing protein [Acetobacteraceae bacterium]|nr:PAS domain-containing protein [Acetobacteraceae bacterium]
MIALLRTAREAPTGGTSLPAAAFHPLLEALPVAVMTCDLETFRIDYANPRSIEMLRSIRHVLKVDPDAIVGTSIDVFHRNPAHQRALLSDPRRLPHRARISVGEETLDLDIHALGPTGRGQPRRAILVWNVATALVAKERETARLMRMIDGMPVAVMTADPQNEFRINYLNETSKRTLRGIEQHLAIKVDAMLGASIDVFHKNPHHQRRLLADPANLPHNAKIRVGPEVLDLQVSAILGEDGAYLGPMLTWSIVTDQVKMAEKVSDVVAAMAKTSSGMADSAAEMLAAAGGAQEMAGSVAAAAEEMSVSIREISAQIGRASTMAQDVAAQASASDSTVRSLSESANRIGDVVELIGQIAGQTNLLALNATIEAARAGEAGKGFAVVASEVKQLAGQTAKATGEIGAQVSAIQGATAEAVTAINGIAGRIEELTRIAMAVAAAVEQQTASTAEVTRAIAGVSRAATETGSAAEAVQGVAADLSGYSRELDAEVKVFLKGR